MHRDIFYLRSCLRPIFFRLLPRFPASPSFPAFPSISPHPFFFLPLFFFSLIFQLTALCWIIIQRNYHHYHYCYHYYSYRYYHYHCSVWFYRGKMWKIKNQEDLISFFHFRFMFKFIFKHFFPLKKIPFHSFNFNLIRLELYFNFV